MAWATVASVARFSPWSSRLWASRERSMARSMTATAGVPARAAGQGVIVADIRGPSYAPAELRRGKQRAEDRGRKASGSSGRFPLPEAFLDLGPDLLVNGVGGQRAVHNDHALGPFFGEQEVALADLGVESDVLALHAVGQAGCALADAREADRSRHVDNDGQVRHDLADGEAVD